MYLPGQMEAIIRTYIVIGALAVLAASVRFYPANTQDRTGAGLRCNVDCTTYDAGYKWAEQRGNDEDNCSDGNRFFYQGCVPNEADNGIGTPLPLRPDDGDDHDNN